MNHVVLMRNNRDDMLPDHVLINGHRVNGVRDVQFHQSYDAPATISLTLIGDKFSPGDYYSVWYQGIRIIENVLSLNIDVQSNNPDPVSISVEMYGWLDSKVITPESCAKCDDPSQCLDCLKEVL